MLTNGTTYQINLLSLSLLKDVYMFSFEYHYLFFKLEGLYTPRNFTLSIPKLSLICIKITRLTSCQSPSGILFVSHFSISTTTSKMVDLSSLKVFSQPFLVLTVPSSSFIAR